ncbi:hypothetical protein J7438_07075 [Thalassotalea sp. G20_0]|uniref:hypothetical protein n=1 Tax=Thalassotalea sp. G20_0 TaxID=2821093 RepID=UPI001ADA7021|nr:hypothetical protein [Thalassotalea sp. G20_0]MBO9493847.1 hypothetical protein [Thalassotalea sp. G20_0]
MSLVIHQSGIDAAINAQANGFSGATLSDVDLFNGATKIKRLPMKGVQVIEPGRIYVVAIDNTPGESYDITKMEFICDTGELYATMQLDDGGVIQSKGPDTTMMLSEQVNISAAPGSVAPSGDVTMYMPHATETLMGASTIASQAKVDAGEDDLSFITSLKLWNWLKKKLSSATNSSSTTTPANSAAVKAAMDAGTRSASETQAGQIEVANDAETKAGIDKKRAVVPYYLNKWKESSIFPSAPHEHEVGSIKGLGDYIVSRGQNANGHYEIWDTGVIRQFGYVTFNSTIGHGQVGGFFQHGLPARPYPVPITEVIGGMAVPSIGGGGVQWNVLIMFQPTAGGLAGLYQASAQVLVGASFYWEVVGRA